MNEKENATCAHTCDTRTHDPSFEEFLKLFGNGYTPLTERAARDKWKITTPLKKRKLIEAMRSGEWKRPRPDWCIMDFPEPRPEVISADEYYKRYETTEELDGWRREYRPEERRSVYIKEP